MDIKLIQCLTNSKLLLLYAENSNWQQFENLQPIWAKEIDNYLAAGLNNIKSEKVALSIESLIYDIDKIQHLIKLQMSKVEIDFSANLKANKALQTYLI